MFQKARVGEKEGLFSMRKGDQTHILHTPRPLSLAKEATNFYKRLASLLADKWDQPYSQNMNWLRCRISFPLLSSAIQCIRGARSSCSHAILSPVHLVTAEAHINHL